MAVDVLLSWPRNCDYPLWRAFLARERWRFARVIVVFTEHDGPDYRDFVRAHVDAECLDSPDRGERDWRDVAVNAGLARSDASHVWFTEQDWTPGPHHWDDLTGDAVGFHENDEPRWHPASLYVSRALIERTGRYFGPEPIDHFTRFGAELDRLTTVRHLRPGYRHMQGLSQNHYLIDAGIDAGIFRREQFRDYLRACLSSGVALHPTWAEGARQEIRSAHL